MNNKRNGSETGRQRASTYSADISGNRNRYALDWAGVLRFAAPTVGLTAALSGLVALTLGAGCASRKPGAEAANSNVTATAAATDAPQPSALQVAPPPAAAAAPAYAPPTAPATPDPVMTQTPTLAASTGAATDPSTGGSTYIVQHGDTLFRIARQHYGDGKQWTRIASANPGLTPANLKAGQKIVLP